MESTFTQVLRENIGKTRILYCTRQTERAFDATIRTHLYDILCLYTKFLALKENGM